jgi:SAM-dependent methyltransferase
MSHPQRSQPVSDGRLRWNAQMVSNSGGAEAAAIRNYLEQRLVREALAVARAHRPAVVALDVGAGFGRLSCVLAEFAPRVIAVERDPQLRQLGQTLNPAIGFIAIPSLDRLPLADASADLALTFTVLQHLSDDECRRVLAEVQRVVPAGHVLLVEETDEEFGPAQFRPESGLHIGRSVARYTEWLAPWQLLQTWPRRIEPTYPRRDVGTAMLFTSPAKTVAQPARHILRGVISFFRTTYGRGSKASWL